MPSLTGFEAQPQSMRFEKPTPRPPKSPTIANNIRSCNRRREYLERNPKYFDDAEHELADPLLYDSLVRKFQTPAEREVEGKAKGYSGVLESSLLRGEARLADLKSSTDDNVSPEPARDFTTEADLSKTKTKEEGLKRWHEFLTERFVRGHDEDFDYSLIDHNEEYDVMERRDAEEAWFDQEDPGWASDANEGVETTRGQTGIQDF
ncbi:coiled-coil domain-containing protein [Colletotrichum orchidophilum]|uniref:Coiled-coil domain-containing protein n=1 Tax=Colletotrichum orchidophilum TaxID=1209926 RepID=A0A1G4BPY4_9PEZI|nr:coiled-coil domain-containing protein [Colletotrichum orchidophilum]OHF03357.1 coiled-coil domain-containing protein [Colletotrichum orchidophilum]